MACPLETPKLSQPPVPPKGATHLASCDRMSVAGGSGHTYPRSSRLPTRRNRASLVRITSSLRADLIFGKDRAPNWHRLCTWDISRHLTDGNIDLAFMTYDLRRCRRGAAFEAEDRDRYVAKIKPNDGTIISDGTVCRNCRSLSLQEESGEGAYMTGRITKSL